MGQLAGDDGLCILEGHPGDLAEVGHRDTGPLAEGQVLAAVDGLVGDGRKANAVRRRSPGAEVSGLDVPDPRRVSSHRVEVGVAEADGIAASAIEVLEFEIALAEEITSEPETGCHQETRPFRQEVVDVLGVGLTAHPLQVGNVIAVAHGEAPDRALRRMSPVVEPDNHPVADLDDVVVAGPDLAVGVESAVDFFCPREPGEATRRHHEVGPCAGINHSSITLSAKGRTDVPAITGEDDAAHEGTALRHVAELDAQAPALEGGWDLALVDRPALPSFLRPNRRALGSLTCSS